MKTTTGFFNKQKLIPLSTINQLQQTIIIIRFRRNQQSSHAVHALLFVAVLVVVAPATPIALLLQQPLPLVLPTFLVSVTASAAAALMYGSGSCSVTSFTTATTTITRGRLLRRPRIHTAARALHQSNKRLITSQQQQPTLQLRPLTTMLHSTTNQGDNSRTTGTLLSSDQQSQQTPYHTLRFCDIGANLLDDRYMKGMYHGTVRHVPDIDAVIQRAIQGNVHHIIVTAGTIDESRLAIQQVRRWNQQYGRNSKNTTTSNGDNDDGKKYLRFSCTVGVHPTRCSQVFCHPDISSTPVSTTSNVETTDTPSSSSIPLQQQEDYANERIQELYDLCVDGVQDNTVVAYGECGLDYDRLEFCSRELQLDYLQRQLVEVALPLNLPLFLHNRNVHTDLYDILSTLQNQYRRIKDHRMNKNDDDIPSSPSSEHDVVATKNSDLFIDKWDGVYRGVVHSFDDTIELAHQFIHDPVNMWYIGINGCSLRTEQNLNTVQQLPLDCILLETDCPYCDVRATHVGHQYIKTTSTNMFGQPPQSEKKFVMGQMVKSRQEPCHIIQIAEIIAGIKNVTIQTVADVCYNNSLQLFGFKE